MEKMVLLYQALARTLQRPPLPQDLPPADPYEDRLAWSSDSDARWYYERRSFPG